MLHGSCSGCGVDKPVARYGQHQSLKKIGDACDFLSNTVDVLLKVQDISIAGSRLMNKGTNLGLEVLEEPAKMPELMADSAQYISNWHLPRMMAAGRRDCLMELRPSWGRRRRRLPQWLWIGLPATPALQVPAHQFGSTQGVKRAFLWMSIRFSSKAGDSQTSASQVQPE